ncbi:TPA: cyclic di-GMP phosphodiesterase, partial [Citrobacter freundii]|nr:cyclic di-GMP phosphodiesterase [Citrobacter freundii]
MKDVRELITLYSYVGTNNPYWRLSEDCNILHFSVEETSEADQTIELSPEQAERIREMTVITSSLLMTLPIEDDNIPVHLVGRKINKREWAGSASAWDDT